MEQHDKFFSQSLSIVTIDATNKDRSRTKDAITRNKMRLAACLVIIVCKALIDREYLIPTDRDCKSSGGEVLST